MNENQNNVCPCCGHTIQPTQWLFREQHEAEWKRQMDANKFSAPYGKFGKTYGLNRYHNEIPKPLPLIAWEQSNPRPEMDMLEFVVQLHNRIAALEAKLGKEVVG